jgi:hypothetical protein
MTATSHFDQNLKTFCGRETIMAVPRCAPRPCQQSGSIYVCPGNDVLIVDDMVLHWKFSYEAFTRILQFEDSPDDDRMMTAEALGDALLSLDLLSLTRRRNSCGTHARSNAGLRNLDAPT